MKFSPYLLCQAIVAAGLICSLSSCEDEALVLKNQELRQQLSELEKKVDLLQINAGEDPGDQTKDLKEANAELATALEQLKQLDDEKEKVEASHVSMEKDLREYQRKYSIQ